MLTKEDLLWRLWEMRLRDYEEDYREAQRVLVYFYLVIGTYCIVSASVIGVWMTQEHGPSEWAVALVGVINCVILGAGIWFGDRTADKGEKIESNIKAILSQMKQQRREGGPGSEIGDVQHLERDRNLHKNVKASSYLLVFGIGVWVVMVGLGFYFHRS